MSTEDDRLTLIADICESVPRERLNNDVAYGVSYAVGYIGGLGAPEAGGDDE